MQHKDGLKPCPFCGRTNQRFLMDMDIYSYPQNRGRRAIICDCGLRLYARDHKEAEEKWQRAFEFVKDIAFGNRWHSVKEKLPENNERVLVAIKHSNSYTMIDTDRILDGMWVRWEGSVTHWRCLPKLPKESEDTK